MCDIRRGKLATRRTILLGSAAMMMGGVGLLLTACGGSSAAVIQSNTTTSSLATSTSTVGAANQVSTKASTSTARPSSAAASVPAGAVNISTSVWGDVSDMDIAKGIIDAFQKKNSNITVTPEQWVGNYYQKLQVDVAGNTVPDMVYFQGWEWQPYALAGRMRVIDDYIARDKSQLPSDLFPEGIDAYVRQLSFKGKHYGIPYDTGNMVMYYNKDLFDAAHVPYPTDSWTSADFLNMVVMVQDGLNKSGKKNVHAYQPNYGDEYYRNFPWWRMNGGMEFDQLEDPKKAQWTQSQVVNAYQQQFHDLVDKGIATSEAALMAGGSGTGGFYNYGIQNGLAAMKVEGPWFLPQMWGSKAATKGGINFDVVHMPKGPRGYSESWNADPLTIWKTSKQPDACWEYLKFAASDEAQRFVAEGGRMTSTPSNILSVWAPIATKAYHFQNTKAFAFIDGASVVYTGGPDESGIFVKGGLDAARDAIVNGSKTAAQAMAEVDQSVQAMLDAWWKDNPNG